MGDLMVDAGSSGQLPLATPGVPDLPSVASPAQTASTQDQLKFRRPRLQSWLMLALLGATVLQFGTHGIYESWLIWALRAVLVLTVAILAWRYISDFRLPLLDPDIPPRTLEALPSGRANTLQQRAGKTRPINSFEAEIFALAITHPSVLRQRVVESYQLESRVLRQQVTVDVQLPRELLEDEYKVQLTEAQEKARPLWVANSPSREAALESEVTVRHAGTSLHRPTPWGATIPLPAVFPLKGELNDDFVLTGADGGLIPVFSYPEYLQLVAAVIRLLLLKSHQCKSEGEMLTEALALAHRAELTALRCIMQRGRRRPGEVEKAVEGILALSVPEGGEKTRNLLADLTRRLSNHYAIVALPTCDDEGRIILRYRRTLIPNLILGDPPKSEPGQAPNQAPKRKRPPRLPGVLKSELDSLLGTRPVNLVLRLNNASTCQSFHLVVACPEGMYLREQKLEDDQGRGMEQYLAAKASIPPYFQLRRRLGQPYAHFYARFFPEPKEPNSLPSLRLRFHEVPPGSIFRAVIAALSSAVLIWGVGFVVSRGGDPGTDAAAILLAFPAIVAGWLGFDAPAGRLLEGTLIARLSLVISAITSICASVLFILYNRPLLALHGSVPFPFEVSFLGINETAWGVLVALAVGNAFFATYTWAVRAREFKSLAGRDNPQQDVPVSR